MPLRYIDSNELSHEIVHCDNGNDALADLNAPCKTGKGIVTLEQFQSFAESYTSLAETVATLSSRCDALENDLQTHKDSDVIRWSEVYALENRVLTLEARESNVILDTENTIDIETQAQSSDGYIVTATRGGRVSFTATIALITIIPPVVYVNGTKVSSFDLLGLGTITDYVDVATGDVITCQGISSMTFTPYISAS